MRVDDLEENQDNYFKNQEIYDHSTYYQIEGEGFEGK